MTDREIMQQALEALKLIDDAMPFPVAKLAMKNLNERLAQPEQEPVAWFTENHREDKSATTYSKKMSERWREKGWPVTPLYTAPPRREWVGLTEEERRGIREWRRIQEELGPVWAPMMLYLYEAIEAKLKEKNT
jgi:hypothetical protein